MAGYGRVDIVWLDGGWVRPQNTITDEVRSWAGMKPWDQDIDMPRIAAMANGHQPGTLIVDRTVQGPFENYRTPEQQLPDQPLDYPWETAPPAERLLPVLSAGTGTEVTLLGLETRLYWRAVKEGIRVSIPRELLDGMPCACAWTFAIH